MQLHDLITDEDRWEISCEELRDLLECRETAPFTFIDCREADEHAEWRIGGEILMPLTSFASEVSQHLEGVQGPIIVYCHHGMRSLHATQYLRAKGHAKTYSLHGGIDAWARRYGATG